MGIAGIFSIFRSRSVSSFVPSSAAPASRVDGFERHAELLGDSISNPHEVALALASSPWRGWLSSSSSMSAGEAWRLAHGPTTGFRVLDTAGWHSRMCVQASLELDECTF